MKKDIITEIDETFKGLLRLLSSFNQEQINAIPFKGSWTAGQLARHLIKSGFGFVKLLNGPVGETERIPDEMVEEIRASFLNFGIKMTSPDFIVPEDTAYEKDDLLNSLESIKAAIVLAILTLDLTKTCSAFELPVIGYLTRLECIYFVIYHTQRHIHQLRNISQKIVTKEKIVQEKIKEEQTHA